MLKLNELIADPGRQQPTKRRGRGEGSGLGKSAGHGNKGKQARSGSGKGPGFEGGQMPLMRAVCPSSVSPTSASAPSAPK